MCQGRCNAYADDDPLIEPRSKPGICKGAPFGRRVEHPLWFDTHPHSLQEHGNCCQYQHKHDDRKSEHPFPDTGPGRSNRAPYPAWKACSARARNTDPKDDDEYDSARRDDQRERQKQQVDQKAAALRSRIVCIPRQRARDAEKVVVGAENEKADAVEERSSTEQADSRLIKALE